MLLDGLVSGRSLGGLNEGILLSDRKGRGGCGRHAACAVERKAHVLGVCPTWDGLRLLSLRMPRFEVGGNKSAAYIMGGRGIKVGSGFELL